MQYFEITCPLHLHYVSIFTDFSCGGNFEYTFCFALTADHRIFAWGRNDCGELGIGYSNTTELSPKLVDLGEIKIAKIASGFGHSLALTADTGEVYAFGRNYRGELGLGDRSDRSNPCKVEGLGSAKIMQISCTAFSSFALTEFGEVPRFCRITYFLYMDRYIDI